MPSNRSALASLLFLAWAAAPALAEVVRLKDGRVLTGAATWIEGGKRLKISAKHGDIIVAKADVVSVEPDPPKPALAGAGTRVWAPHRAKVWLTIPAGWEVVEGAWPSLTSRRLGVSVFVSRGPVPRKPSGRGRSLDMAWAVTQRKAQLTGTKLLAAKVTRLAGREAGELVYVKGGVTTRELLFRDRLALITLYLRTRAPSLPPLTDLLGGLGFGRPPRGAKVLETRPTKSKPVPVEAKPATGKPASTGANLTRLGTWEVRFPAPATVKSRTRDGASTLTASLERGGVTFRAVTGETRIALDRASLKVLIQQMAARRLAILGEGARAKQVSESVADRHGAIFVRAEFTVSRGTVTRSWLLWAGYAPSRLLTLAWTPSLEHAGPFDKAEAEAFFASLKPKAVAKAVAKANSEANRIVVGRWSIRFPATPSPIKTEYSGGTKWKSSSALSGGVVYALETATLPEALGAKRLASFREDSTRGFFHAYSEKEKIRTRKGSDTYVTHAGSTFLRAERRARHASQTATGTWVVWTSVDGRRFVRLTAQALLRPKPSVLDLAKAEAVFASLKPAPSKSRIGE